MSRVQVVKCNVVQRKAAAHNVEINDVFARYESEEAAEFAEFALQQQRM